MTVAAGSLTGIPLVHQDFDLPLDFVRHVSAPDTYRDAGARNCHTDHDYAQLLAQELENLIQAEGPDTVAAFIAEPVMGTGGVLIPPDGYFQEIKKVLDRHDVLLISDEVICGFGRLGSWFGAQKYAFEPDLITTAKGLTSGYQPLSALLVGERVWSVLHEHAEDGRVFGHGFTYSGHPICTAAALANLDIIEREGLVERAAELGPYLLDRMTEKVATCRIVGDVRGAGMMLGIELVADRETKTPFEPRRKIAARVMKVCMSKGLLCRALPNSDIIAISPPFVIGKGDIDCIADRMDQALEQVVNELQDEKDLDLAWVS